LPIGGPTIDRLARLLVRDRIGAGAGAGGSRPARRTPCTDSLPLSGESVPNRR